MEYVLSKQEIFYSKRNDKGSVGVEIRNLPAFQFNNINGKGVIRSFDSVLKLTFDVFVKGVQERIVTAIG